MTQGCLGVSLAMFHCQAKICISLLLRDFLNFACMSESESEVCIFATKGSKTLSCALEPEASTSPSYGLTSW